MIAHLYFLAAFMALCLAAIGIWHLIGGLDDYFSAIEADEGNKVLLDAAPYKIAPCDIGVCPDASSCACRISHKLPVHSTTTSGAGGREGAEQRVRTALERRLENEGREYW